MIRKIKFKIGEQCENHEFDLDWVNTIFENNLRFEVYQYIGHNKNTIFGYEVQKTLLAYNCDFLAGVFYFIEFDKYPDLIASLNFKISKKIEVGILKNSTLFNYRQKEKLYNCVIAKILIF